MSHFARCAFLTTSYLLCMSGSAHAQDAVASESSAAYPLLFQGAMALGPAGGEGRWGIAFERHPGVHEGERRSGLGIGYGAAAGYALIGGAMSAADTTSKPSQGGWIAPALRPGFFFGMRKETFVSGCLCVGAIPTVDILSDGSVRGTLSAEPGFLMSVERFAFGLGMNVGGTLLAAGPRDERGLAIGVVTQLGAVL